MITSLFLQLSPLQHRFDEKAIIFNHNLGQFYNNSDSGMFTACFDAGDAGRTLPCTHLVTPIHHPSMTPEKRPAEDEEEQEEAPKKLKEDTSPSVAEATQEDDSSQDSVGSDSATSSDPQKKVHKERTLCAFFPCPGILRVSWRSMGLARTPIGWVTG